MILPDAMRAYEQELLQKADMLALGLNGLKAAAPEPEADRLIYHVDNHKKQKPMTIDEAMLEMDGREYLVYRDANTERMMMLVRRRDGHFDLVEA